VALPYALLEKSMRQGLRPLRSPQPAAPEVGGVCGNHVEVVVVVKCLERQWPQAAGSKHTPWRPSQCQAGWNRQQQQQQRVRALWCTGAPVGERGLVVAAS
jgi:hypothetical protein